MGVLGNKPRGGGGGKHPSQESSPSLLGICNAVLHDIENDEQINDIAKRSSTSRHKEAVNNAH
jgi:hypothetical protein